MRVNHVLAVVAVDDFEVAAAWYERLFGRVADNLPMAGQLIEWRVTESGWLQVTRDPARAGSGLLNLAVEDLPGLHAELASRGLSASAIEVVKKDVRLAALTDPDGNTITFIGNFRVEY
jgi:hypothetical protein